MFENTNYTNCNFANYQFCKLQHQYHLKPASFISSSTSININYTLLRFLLNAKEDIYFICSFLYKQPDKRHLANYQWHVGKKLLLIWLPLPWKSIIVFLHKDSHSYNSDVLYLIHFPPHLVIPDNVNLSNAAI